MRIQVISGPMASGKTTKLRAIQTKLEQQGFNPSIIAASHISTQALIRTIARQFDRCLTVLVDDCSQEQIESIFHWYERTERSGEFSDVVIHLVKQA